MLELIILINYKKSMEEAIFKELVTFSKYLFCFESNSYKLVIID